MTELRKQYNIFKKFRVWFGSNSVIVLTMGKVGTLTICNSLDNIGIQHVHPHSMWYSKPGTHFIKNVNLSFYQKLYFNFKTLTKRFKVKLWLLFSKKKTIITGVRDPFSRSISAFFEQSHYLNLNLNELSSEEVFNKFNKHYDLISGLYWFDNEVKKTFNIDIYSKPFNKVDGFQIITKGRYKLFIYRLDKLNQLELKIKEFIENPLFRIQNTNETERSVNYKEVKSKQRFTFQEFQTVENSKFINHFYTSDEILKMKERWIQ